VLAPRGGGGGPAHVEAGGEREVDGVHVRVVEDRLVGAVEKGGRDVEAVVGGEEAGLLLGAAPDGGDGCAGREQHGARKLARDGGAAKDAEAHGARRLVWVWRRGGRHGRRPGALWRGLWLAAWRVWALSVRSCGVGAFARERF